MTRALAQFFPRAGDLRSRAMGASEQLGGTVSSHSFSRTAALDRVFAGPGRMLLVEAHGDAGISIRFELQNGDTITRPATTGMLYRIPYRSAAVVIPAPDVLFDELLPDLRILTATDPHAVEIVAASEWVPFRIQATGAGNANIDVQLPGGFEYDVFGVSVELVCDATIANRSPVLDVFDRLGTTQIDGSGNPRLITANETSRWSVVAHSAAQFTLVIGTGSWQYTGMIPWRAIIETAAGLQFRVRTVNGVAGDGVTFHVFGKKRGI